MAMTPIDVEVTQEVFKKTYDAYMSGEEYAGAHVIVMQDFALYTSGAASMLVKIRRIDGRESVYHMRTRPDSETKKAPPADEGLEAE